MLELIFRLRFHVTTIIVGFVAGIAFVVMRQQPQRARDLTYIFWLPALVALLMWIRTGIANWSDNRVGDAAMFLLLGEKLLVAYLAFAVGWAIGLLAA